MSNCRTVLLVRRPVQHCQPMNWPPGGSTQTPVSTETAAVTLDLGDRRTFLRGHSQRTFHQRHSQRTFHRGRSRSIYRSTTPSSRHAPVAVTMNRPTTATASWTTGTVGRVLLLSLQRLGFWGSGYRGSLLFL